MIVGVKYCGGCNSRYNRKALVDTLVEKFSHHCFSQASPHIHYDVLLVVNGCSSGCAEITSFHSDRVISLVRPEDISQAILSLEKGD